MRKELETWKLVEREESLSPLISDPRYIPYFLSSPFPNVPFTLFHVWWYVSAVNFIKKHDYFFRKENTVSWVAWWLMFCIVQVGPSTFFSAKQFEVFDVELLSIQNCERRTIGFYSDVVCNWDKNVIWCIQTAKIFFIVLVCKHVNHRERNICSMKILRNFHLNPLIFIPL